MRTQPGPDQIASIIRQIQADLQAGLTIDAIRCVRRVISDFDWISLPSLRR